MSRENVEIVRRMVAARIRGDWDAALEDATPEFEYDLSHSIGPFRGVLGLDEARQHMAEVVVPLTLRYQGRGGIEVQARPTFVFTLRDGSVTRVCLYQERAEALEAVGLRE